MNPELNDITHILSAIERGEPQAAEALLPLVYDELRRLAAAQMAREKPGQTLDATGLVHEAWLRLVGLNPEASFADRSHFLAAAAEAMRRILVEGARRKQRLKRGGTHQRQAIDLDAVAAVGPDENILALNEALERLAAHDSLKAQLVELRFFGGLTLAESAECLGISLSTADRAWRYARAWLYSEMTDAQEKEGPGGRESFH